jgi:hypothetical protein
VAGEERKTVIEQLLRSLLAATFLMAISFVVFLVVQTAVYRLRVFKTMGRNLFVVCLLVCAAEIVCGPFLIPSLVDDAHDRWLISILSSVGVFGLTGIYLMVLPVSLERSFSVRLLVNLLNKDDNSLTKSDVERLHTREQIYELRYREMTEGGIVKIEGDRLTLLPRGKRIARLYLLLGQSMGYPAGFNN